MQESQTTRDGRQDRETRSGRLSPMASLARQPWLLGIFSAALLLLPFSIVGPVPFWRTFFACWIWVVFLAAHADSVALAIVGRIKAGIVSISVNLYPLGFVDTAPILRCWALWINTSNFNPT